jgi:hypothetical protein
VSRSRVAWLLWAFGLAMLVAGAALSAVGGGPLDEVLSDVVIVPVAATVGALIFARVRGNPIGWIFLGVGVLGGLSALLAGYADSALLADAGSSRLGDVCADATRWLWAPVSLISVTFGLLLFPDGRLPSRRFRAFPWLAGVGIVALGAFVGLSTADESWRAGGNAHASEQTGVGLAILGVLSIAVVPALIGSVAAVIVRFRRSIGEERQQLKWLAYGGTIAAVVLFVAGTAFDEKAGTGVVIAAALASIPLWIGVAILRYRLYDIDVVINRTLVYAALTATLGLAYLGSVLLLQLALSGVTEGSGLAVAASTLAVAALFRPARSRIQEAVARRFYRRKYDAARTLARFGSQLRDEVDLDALGSALRRVVTETMQPAHVSLWLRSPETKH